MTTLALSWRTEEARDVWQSDRNCGASATGAEATAYNITRNPRVFGGASVIAGTRVPVFMIEDLYDDGADIDTILDYYPHLTEGQVFSALAYADTFAGFVAGDRAAYEAVARAHGA